MPFSIQMSAHDKQHCGSHLHPRKIQRCRPRRQFRDQMEQILSVDEIFDVLLSQCSRRHFFKMSDIGTQQSAC